MEEQDNLTTKVNKKPAQRISKGQYQNNAKYKKKFKTSTTNASRNHK